MKNKVTIYTSSTCPYCKQIKDKFKEEKIEFIEKTNEKFEGEWYKVNFLTGLPIFPTIKVNGNYLIPQRDFHTPEHAVSIVDYITGPEYPNYTNHEILIEKIKTLNYTINNGFMHINKRLDNILKERIK